MIRANGNTAEAKLLPARWAIARDSKYKSHMIDSIAGEAILA
jgi:hypothetical protein